MSGRLRREIKQRKPFRSPQLEAYLNLLKTTDTFQQKVAAELKPYGISETWYNVLRILRGAEPDGMACREIGSRMITRDPDVTRLLDRMEARGLITRRREEKDRRVVITRITKEGLRLLKELELPLDRLLGKLLSHVGIQNLRQLIELLELARAG